MEEHWIDLEDNIVHERRKLVTEMMYNENVEFSEEELK